MTPLQLANVFESAVGQINGDGLMGSYNRTGWFSAWYAVNSVTHEHGLLQMPADANVRDLDRVAELVGPPGPERQLLRVLGLTLLAELAERGELTLEGLQ